MDIRWDSVRWWFDQVGQVVGAHARRCRRGRDVSSPPVGKVARSIGSARRARGACSRTYFRFFVATLTREQRIGTYSAALNFDLPAACCMQCRRLAIPRARLGSDFGGRSDTLRSIPKRRLLESVMHADAPWRIQLSSTATRSRRHKEAAEPRSGCVEPNELLSTARQYGGREPWLVALAEHAARFRNIYFPLTASDSLPGRPRHGKQQKLRIYTQAVRAGHFTNWREANKDALNGKLPMRVDCEGGNAIGGRFFWSPIELTGWARGAVLDPHPPLLDSAAKG
ncbi:hypothetical protein DBV15_05558 [Temnothorax longispinosus]|uniref:Uncharacterized protein n=1 Tax=Temnothorax longispinosus TaxID=300112 RepID=A0A4S2KV28_9HYME|nr:hypothetical protein DBV15_05558 [Temnothorax longispinosus]